MSSSTARRRPSLPPMPDLEHLTEEERAIIESVIQRQREEEEKEQQILRYGKNATTLFMTFEWFNLACFASILHILEPKDNE